MKFSTGLTLGAKFFFNSFWRPSVMALESSNDCQASCIMCHRGKLERNKESMSLEVFKKAIHEAKKNRIKIIQLSFYGEPLLDSNFGFKLKYIREHLPHVTIVFNTNGEALTDALIDDILKYEVNEVRFSIEGNDAKEYEQIRKGLSFAKLVYNVAKLKIARDEANSKLKIMIWALNLKAFPIEEEKFRSFWKDYADHIHIRHENKIIMGKKDNLLQKVAPCPKPFAYVVVLTDGRVTICDIDWYGKHTYGSLKDKSIRQLWFSKRMLALRFGHLFGFKRAISPCSTCSYKTLNSQFQNSSFAS